jgi:hypothetical protein
LLNRQLAVMMTGPIGFTLAVTIHEQLENRGCGQTRW